MRQTPGTPRHVWVNVTSDPQWARPGLEITSREVPGPRGGRAESWTVCAVVERPSGTLRVREGWTRAEHLVTAGPPPAPREPRHVLVRLGPDSLDVHPGLLLFWWGIPAIGGAQWLAWVVWAAGGGPHEVEAHQGWLRGDQLRPARPEEPVSRGRAGRTPDLSPRSAGSAPGRT